MDRLARIQAESARAALNPLALPELLWLVRDMIGGVMGTMEHYCKHTHRVEMLVTDRPDLQAISREPYESHYYKLKRRNDLAIDLPLGTILTDDLLGDDRLLSRDEFYIDFLAKYGMRYFIGAVLVDDDDQLIWTSIQRGPDQPRVGAEEQRAYRAALPHLSNALALYSRMRALPSGTALAETLDRIAEPIAIVAADRHVLFANRIMRAIFDESTILGTERGRLTAFGAPLRAALVRLIAAVRAGQLSARETVARPGGLRPLTLRAVVLTPEHGREFQAGEGTLFCLMIDDPERPFASGIGSSAETYGLTPREAMVGSYLVAGRTAGEIALRLALSRNTVRSHIARLREKVGERSALGVAARLRADNTMLG